jgi:hypothetical protein
MRHRERKKAREKDGNNHIRGIFNLSNSEFASNSFIWFIPHTRKRPLPNCKKYSWRGVSLNTRRITWTSRELLLIHWKLVICQYRKIAGLLAQRKLNNFFQIDFLLAQIQIRHGLQDTNQERYFRLCLRRVKTYWWKVRRMSNVNLGIKFVFESCKNAKNTVIFPVIDFE